MQEIANFEKVLLKAGVNYQESKIIDDFLLTGNPECVRDFYRCCQSDIADVMVTMLEMKDDLTVLEPGAGKGVILKKLLKYPNHCYCEKNVGFVIQHLCSLTNNFQEFNFFDVKTKFDRIVINPPFSFKEYERHIIHGYDLLKETGIMVFLYPKIANYLPWDSGFETILKEAQKTEVGKVCGDCECVIGKVTKK